MDSVSIASKLSKLSGMTTMTTSTSSNSLDRASPLPTDSIVVRKHQELPPEEDKYRAVHRIRLSALEHNYACVESAANRQRCSVIAVVKADGYGHGAAATALHLSDSCGADAFAVATLEEAIALRKAFENNPPGRWSKQIASLFHTGGFDSASHSASHSTASYVNSRSSSPTNETKARTMRPSQIRILVLGPPVGFPRCFDDYYYYGIEVMVSGPEVAHALLQWVVDEKERKRLMVERAASETKEKALLIAPLRETYHLPAKSSFLEEKKDAKEGPIVLESPDSSEARSTNRTQAFRHPSSTLSNVSGQDLAKEVRNILINQKAAHHAAVNAPPLIPQSMKSGSTVSAPATENNSSAENSVASDNLSVPLPRAPAPMKPPAPPRSGAVFGGIEAAARTSRARERAAVRSQNVFNETSDDIPAPFTVPVPPGHRKRLRWHALVDSGMGRLGFKPDPVRKDDKSGAKDSVDIIKELVDAEIHQNAPIEFYGMVTHMADANDTSDYTNAQILRFISLLKRVREAEISVPTVSTDNSAALLTTKLTHFNPSEILSQPGSNTRGFVRIGGAIYGQRPAFTQLKAVSTLLASVRHVAVLKKGESVGYDRAYIAPYDVRIATLTIGFADGYPRELGNGVGRVQIRGAVFPVAGNVCMDMLMVELGPAEDKEGKGATICVGDTAVLWGPLDEDDKEGMVRLQDIAKTLKTTQSALTCGLDKIRVSRQFV